MNSLKPGRRRRFGLFNGLRFIATLSTALLLLGLGLQWLVPKAWGEWQTEAYLTERLSRPVDLQGVALGLFPLPHVGADAAEVGDANAILLRGGGLRLYFDPVGLFR